MRSLLKFLRWLAGKAAMAVLILAVGLAAGGLWLFVRDHVSFDLRRSELVMTLTGERAKIKEALADVNQRLEKSAAGIAAGEDRLRRIDRVIAQIKELDHGWDRLFDTSEQAKTNAQRIARMKELRAETASQVDQLKTAHERTTWEKDGLEVALGRLDVRMKAVEASQSKIVRYLAVIWDRSKFWIVLTLAVYFIGPTLGKLALYFGFAPLVALGRPVRLANEGAALPEIGESHVTAEVVLQPGERLWVKEKFLQTSDEGLSRRTRYVLDWRIPFTCLASGLIELVELRNRRPENGGQACTLSNQADPHSELALVTLPPGASIVMRPSFLAGAIAASGQRLVIRRRWQLFRWQAWVTLQFRFFEFAGPARLVLAGSRGVRVERLHRQGEGTAPARRTNQDATIGFTPNLDYRPARAETFWSYYRGMNPLFDDLFAGEGVFLCQQVSSEGDARSARKMWSNFWSGLLKVFGL
jgi:hypothetical protein